MVGHYLHRHILVDVQASYLLAGTARCACQGLTRYQGRGSREALVIIIIIGGIYRTERMGGGGGGEGWKYVDTTPYPFAVLFLFFFNR